MALVRYSSYHSGSVPKEVEASTPAEIAESEGFSVDTDKVRIFVDSEPATLSTRLRKGQVVQFTKARQESGSA